MLRRESFIFARTGITKVSELKNEKCKHTAQRNKPWRATTLLTSSSSWEESGILAEQSTNRKREISKKQNRYERGWSEQKNKQELTLTLLVGSLGLLEGIRNFPVLP
jgi:hypothetical protein